MRTVNITFPSNSTQNSTPERYNVLVLGKTELDRIKQHMQWLHKDAKEAEKEKAKRQKAQKLSKRLAKEWPDPLKALEDERLERQKAEEEEENQKHLEALKEKEAERKKYIDNCKKLLFFSNDCVKSLHGALLFSEVLRERDAQINFEKVLKESDDQREAGYALKISNDEALYAEKLREIRKKINKQESYKKELFNQIGEKEAKRLEEIKGDKEELEAIKRDVESKEAKHKEQIQKKKESTRKFFEDALIADRNVKEKMQIDEEAENKLQEVYAAVKQRIARLRKGKMALLKQEQVNRRIALTEMVSTTRASTLAAEEQSLQRAIAEKERLQNEMRLREAAYRKKLVDEIKETRKEQLAKEEKAKQEEKEMKMWELLQRYKQDEINKKACEDKIKMHKDKCAMTRRLYDEQMVENNAIMNKNKEEASEVKRLVEKWHAEDEEFLKYSKEVIEESKEKGRLLLPMLKVVEEYKRKNLLKSIQKDNPLMRSRIPFGPRYNFNTESKSFIKEEPSDSISNL